MQTGVHPCTGEVEFRRQAFAKLQETRERTQRLVKRAAAAEKDLKEMRWVATAETALMCGQICTRHLQDWTSLDLHACGSKMHAPEHLTRCLCGTAHAGRRRRGSRALSAALQQPVRSSQRRCAQSLQHV